MPRNLIDRLFSWDGKRRGFLYRMSGLEAADLNHEIVRLGRMLNREMERVNEHAEGNRHLVAKLHHCRDVMRINNIAHLYPVEPVPEEEKKHPAQNSWGCC